MTNQFKIQQTPNIKAAEYGYNVTLSVCAQLSYNLQTNIRHYFKLKIKYTLGDLVSTSKLTPKIL
ncbi:hypothetical protein B9Q09_01475 [Candidatus Marsarchaeota G2 archaeon ECH_B_SAG-C16]|uniref:Uncharacterized protein n=4 Tax=Candidatus Marsarchaeota group 2 TaxID=2203771 RepID=A0A2R6B815_9ARCH|nr:MAG: hypothetical protein B9Q06_07885 [Candidatus Marsarchaeota G2 archaeon ECH_B_2]PSN97062.1 MAG: hypothetical protein B9Q09_01475 [Candidatus Marsarchaeota G2 archaeon ECH_B_SAG-C16]PSN99245.1 MAG: hypothetical protein B9Q07_07360 [Candidatus Marsarchaeota G2 archaeon ECH_B_3]PSO01572.1 MAG: hypothetical protein B9Q05_08535 [Candidatus Marsarchaeota G2 archaeon ECH_B_1]